ncbi:protein SCO1/2 [Mucilaginibacter gracilis]|uniref:Protein SCO1/2 n=1 Tax=Mucilaginibacter gracilis TaxID=423350 RepID=A0A495J2N8_9SPHI|nr:SCO family protein [Mucilaginibacter gracilis]RKR83245.1 protein SCO1/2 [Mucilaginibacter gracilis]
MKQLNWLISGLLFLTACHSATTGTTTLPIFGDRQPITKTVDGKQVTDTLYQTIPAFKFVNQYGDTITNKSLDGKIYVADFFFTSCPSICPIMQRNMLTVYNEFKNDPNIKILSHTIDPKHDTIPVLKNYADKLGISGNSWWLLYGKREDIYQLAEKHYLVSVKDGKEGLIHEGWFLLVDKQKRIRGSYDGTVPEQVAKLVADIHTLQQEK